MDGESPNTVFGPADQTIAAIHEVAKTMEGDSLDYPGGAGLYPIASAPSMPAERLNSDLEDGLVDIGCFGRRSMAQKMVLGCLGCKLASQPGNTGAVRSLEIAQCTGMKNSPVRRILGKLVTGGFLKVEKREEGQLSGKLPDYFRLTARSVTNAFKRKLQIPTGCGLEEEGRTRRFNAEGESLLIETGAFGTRGGTHRAILGCLACQLQRGGGVHVRGIRRCLNTASGHIADVVKRMENAGVLQRTDEHGISPGGHRTVYTPAGTALARQIVTTLEMPPNCGLEDKK